jgi:hypothetical protein
MLSVNAFGPIRSFAAICPFATIRPFAALCSLGAFRPFGSFTAISAFGTVGSLGAVCSIRAIGVISPAPATPGVLLTSTRALAKHVALGVGADLGAGLHFASVGEPHDVAGSLPAFAGYGIDRNFASLTSSRSAFAAGPYVRVLDHDAIDVSRSAVALIVVNAPIPPTLDAVAANVVRHFVKFGI